MAECVELAGPVEPDDDFERFGMNVCACGIATGADGDSDFDVPSIEITVGTDTGCGIEITVGADTGCGIEITVGADTGCGIEITVGADTGCGIDTDVGPPTLSEYAILDNVVAKSAVTKIDWRMNLPE